MVCIKEVDSPEALKSSRDPLLAKNFQILRCWTRRLFVLWTRSSRIPKEGQSRGTESRERGPVSSRKDRSLFMTHDYFRVTRAHDAVLDYASLFNVTLHNDNIQEFDTRWDEILLCRRFHPMISSTVCTNWGHVSLFQLKAFLELYDMEIYQKISMTNYPKLKTMVKRSIDRETSFPKLWRQTRGILKQEQWSRIERAWVALKGGKGICYQWKEKGQCWKGNECCFRHESDDHAPTDAAKAAPPSGRSHTSRILRQPCRYYLKRVLVRDRLVNIGILPSVNFTKQKRDGKARISAWFPHLKVDEQPNRRPQKGYYSQKKEKATTRML